MKVLLFISTLILIVSCGKYEKPFITFKSPEKRITDGTWGCTKVVSEEGVESLIVEDRITFRIDGTDSIFTRITNHSALSTTPQSSELTGQWENKLRQIEKGQYTSNEFKTELYLMIRKLTDEVVFR